MSWRCVGKNSVSQSSIFRNFLSNLILGKSCFIVNQRIQLVIYLSIAGHHMPCRVSRSVMSNLCAFSKQLDGLLHHTMANHGDLFMPTVRRRPGTKSLILWFHSIRRGRKMLAYSLLSFLKKHSNITVNHHKHIHLMQDLRG